MANLLGQNIGTNYKGILNLNTLNGNLTTTLEAITDGDGNASPLNLGTTSIRFGGATGLFWDNANNFLGLGTSSPSRTLTVSGNGARIRDLNVGVTTQTSIGNTNNIIANWATLGVGIANGTALTASAMLHVRGDGTNPIALFENGAGTSQFNIQQSGVINFANQLQGPLLRASTNLACSAFTNQSYNGTIWLTVNDTLSTLAFTTTTINLSAGSTSPRMYSYAYTINNSGAQTGTATGIFLNATETALNGMSHNLMDLQRGGVSQFLVDRIGIVTAQAFIGTSYIRGRLLSTSGIQLLEDTAGGTFNRLQFGGTTNAFPAIKRNGAQIDFRLADDSGYANINTGVIFGYTAGGSPMVRFKLGEISGGQGISTRDGQFSIGFTDANQNAGVRFLATGSGVSYIDGWSEGTTKATNYRVVFGSRINNTGTSITGSTTAENGTPFVFGFDVHDASAIVQINSTTRGFLPPRMTTTQKNAITTPATGLVLYDSTLNKLCVYTGSAWETITSV
jgi:hypothetical protein